MKLPRDWKAVSYDEFYGVLAEMSEFLMKHFTEMGCKHHPVKSRHIMNCWMIDGKKAIFGFPINYDADEIAFVTFDSNMTSYINNMILNINDAYNNVMDEFLE